MKLREIGTRSRTLARCNGGSRPLTWLSQRVQPEGQVVLSAERTRVISLAGQATPQGSLPCRVAAVVPVSWDESSYSANSTWIYDSRRSSAMVRVERRL